MTNGSIPFDELSGIHQIVADTLRFKQRLRIGRKAFKLLKAKDSLYSLWDTFGVGATGAAVAKSSLVATTFFAPSGIMAWLGLATAATPIGWVAAAALVSGTVYYGVNRYLAEDESKFVDVIPKYINTPIDLIGLSLFGLIGGLSVRVATVNGPLDPQMRKAITDHFSSDWGYDHAFIERALPLLERASDTGSISSIAKALAEFQSMNPDCNANAMQKELLTFLRNVVEADGIVTNREQSALDVIAGEFDRQRGLPIARLGQKVKDAVEVTGKAASEATLAVGSALGGAMKGLGDKLATTRWSIGSRRDPGLERFEQRPPPSAAKD